MQFFSFLVVLALFAVINAQVSLRGASNSKKLASSSESEESEDYPDFTNTTVLVNFFETQLLTEPWVDPNFHRLNQRSPLKGFVDEDAILAMGGKELNFVFDMFDRAEMKGVATTAFSSFNQFAAWYATRSNQFKARYRLLAQPVPLARGFNLASPGNPVGQFRTNVLGDIGGVGGVPFWDVSYLVRTGTVPVCDPGNGFRPPPTPPSLGSYTVILMVRSVKGFYKAGQTIKVLTDPNGNVYYGLSQRIAPVSGKFGWTLSDYTFTEDETTSCLRSSFVPDNEDLDQPIVCKQLQVVDDLGNTYLFMRGPATLQGNDRIVMDAAARVSGPLNTFMSCDDLSLTIPLVGDGNNGNGNGNGNGNN
eukprot:gene29568-35687_t